MIDAEHADVLCLKWMHQWHGWYVQLRTCTGVRRQPAAQLHVSERMVVELDRSSLVMELDRACRDNKRLRLGLVAMNINCRQKVRVEECDWESLCDAPLVLLGRLPHQG